MLVIGLTGGIGSGKTTVAALFAKHDVPVIDADQIARFVTNTNQIALKAIKEHFSDEVLLKNGQLDRSKLREIIFNNANERQWLENLLHPLILTKMKQELSKLNAPYCILEIPLLIEVNPYPFIERILVVDATYETQRERIALRDQISKDHIDKMIKSQTDRETRLQHAHDVIINDGILADLEPQVERLHQKYLKIAENS